MNVYDSIKSPFEDNDTLKKIIEIYSRIKTPSPSSADLYNAITKYSNYKENFENYMDNFDQYIF